MKFSPKGLLALEPAAYGQAYDRAPALAQAYGGAAPSEAPAEQYPAVVSIRGPLMYHFNEEFDSYEYIKMRVGWALSSPGCSCVVLDIDSPGGLVAGCFDTAKELRKMAQKAGKPIFAFATNATSAAYALACCADAIVTSETGRLGSIGVIETLVDATGQDAAMGLAFALVTSGARKSDGNPHGGISGDAIAHTQASVDTAAQLFYEYVAARRGVSAESVKSLEAGIFLGQQAVSLRLADSLATLDSLLAMVADSESVAALTESKQEMAQGTVSAAIEALTKAAESDDKDERANARRMLAKYYAEDAQASDDDGEKKDDKAPEEEKDDKKASDDSDKKDEDVKDEKKDDDKSAKALEASNKALAAVQKLEAMMQEAKESGERATLIASRKDFAPEMVALLSAAPIETVRKFVKELPVGKAPARSTVKDAQAALASAAPAQGDTEGEGDVNAPRGEHRDYTLAALDVQCGLRAQATGVINDGPVTKIPLLTPEQARAKIAAAKKATV